MANELFFDEFISNFIKNLGPWSAFSCILDVQFLKKNSGFAGNCLGCAEAKKISFLVGGGASQTFGLLGT